VLRVGNGVCVRVRGRCVCVKGRCLCAMDRGRGRRGT
jgi:hypothetical protein